ncbi:MAG: hypothetical protein IIT46_04695 [Lachnospiraceae bacterium]|jgi:hypothetical protein|nr:hypothetical protein [Lachnospiraceae bacterium]MBQ5559060.1 hypothetical protein [Lachnospiraceae bacterium]
MIKVYYNKYQFQKGEEEGKKTVAGYELKGEVEYVPSTNNKIVVGASEDDKADWEVFQKALKEYLEYFLKELLSRADEQEKADENKLLLDHFIIVQK